MASSKEIGDIFNKFRLLFSIFSENLTTEETPKSNKDGLFNCDKCKAKFKKLRFFRRHMKRVHIKAYKCTICSYVCGENFELKKHIATKHNIKDGLFNCDMCKTKFKDMTMFKRHTKDVHIKPNKCTLCSYNCGTNFRLKKHMETKHNDNGRKAKPTEIKIYKCDLCMKEFTKKVKYTTHKRRIHTKAFKCHECNNQFGTPFELKQHVDQKHLGLAIKCNICDKVLANKKSFKRHMMLHSNEFQNCDNCEYSTRSIPQMKRHTQVHHSEIQFQCTLCSYRAKEKKNLDHHIRRKHVKIKEFKCELCEYACYDKYGLRKHKASIHEGQRIKCDECQLSFSVTSLSSHKRRYHSNYFFECEDCSYGTKDNSSLKQHKKAEHEGIRYKCTICPKETRSKYRLSQHIKQTHDNPEYHICDQCNYKTTRKGCLLRHVRIHGEKLECDKCPYTTAWKSLLRSHTEVEHLGLGHTCNICGVRKTRKWYLEQHMKSKHKELKVADE